MNQIFLLISVEWRGKTSNGPFVCKCIHQYAYPITKEKGSQHLRALLVFIYFEGVRMNEIKSGSM